MAVQTQVSSDSAVPAGSVEAEVATVVEAKLATSVEAEVASVEKEAVSALPASGSNPAEGDLLRDVPQPLPLPPPGICKPLVLSGPSGPVS